MTVPRWQCRRSTPAEGKTIPQVARDLDLTQSALRAWVERAREDRSKGKTGLTTAELTMERDILKEAAAYFAKHQR